MSRIAVSVSSASASGSTSMKSRPNAERGAIPSTVSWRYSVVSSPSGSRSA